MNLRLLLAACALLGLAATAASAQTVINTVPYTISTSGKYVLGTNLIVSSASTRAITVSAPNVILDLNGFFVSGPGSTPSSGTAVIYVGDVSNVTIRNGTIANNGIGVFYSAPVGSTNSLNYVLEDLNITRCYLDGVRFTADAPGSIIRNCTFSSNGGSTQTGVTRTDAIYCFNGLRIEGNTVTTVTVATNTGAQSFGINADTDCFIINNAVSGCTVGFNYGKQANNLTSSCTTPFQNGTLVGYNN